MAKEHKVRRGSQQLEGPLRPVWLRGVRAGVVVILVVAASIGVTTSPASAHAPHDNISDVAMSPAFSSDSTVLAISRGHLLRSTNKGTTWTEVTRGLDRHGLTRLASAPSDKNRLYLLLLSRGVYRSDDQGRSWAPTARPGNLTSISDVVVSPTSADVLFAAPTSSGLYRSVDGGQQWTAVGAFGKVTALAVLDSTHVVVGDDTGAVRTSSDTGATWSASVGVAPGDPVTALASHPSSSTVVFAGSTSGRVYRSDTSGATFTAVGSGVPAGVVTSIAVSDSYATDTTVWVSSWHEGVFRSTDGGVTFIKRSVNLVGDPQAEENNEPDFGRVVVGRNATGKSTLYVAGYHGLYRSTNAADRWNEIETLTEYISAFGVSPDYANDGTVLAGTYVKGVFASRDRGKSWVPADVGLGSAGMEFLPVQRVQSLAYSPDYVNDGTIFLTSTSRIFVSTDRGASWTESVLGAQLDQPRFTIAVSPAYASDHTVYLGSSGGDLWRSVSGGASNSWQLVTNRGSKIRSIVLSPTFASDRVMYASTLTGVSVSTDAGASWAPTGPTTISLLAISPNYANDRTVFAGTEYGLLVTRDAGATWTKLGAAPLTATSYIEAVAVSPNFAADQTVLVSVRGAGLFRSTNAGGSFQAVGTSLIASNVHVQDCNAPTSAPLAFSPAYASDRTIFGYGADKVVRSVDGGTTWSVLNLPKGTTLLKPPVVAAAPVQSTVVEGALGSQSTLRLTFELSYPFAKTVTVQWNTVDVLGNPNGASSSAGDFVAASGTLTFPPGSTRQVVSVTVNGDATPEADELVVVSLHDPTNAKIGGYYGLGFATILDDD